MCVFTKKERERERETEEEEEEAHGGRVIVLTVETRNSYVGYHDDASNVDILRPGLT